MTTKEPRIIHHHRSLFLSDLHLGAVGARADLALRFLQENSADHYILVGDILDIWHPLLPSWTGAADAVIAHFRRRQSEGATLTYVSGNHDPDPGSAPDQRQLPVAAVHELIHEGADGRRYLITHGDREDRRALRGHILTRIGSRLDNGLRRFDQRLRYWLRSAEVREDPARRSVIEWCLSSVNAAFYTDRSHERRLVALARAQGADGVICGHFHIAALHDRHGLTYANCGDWMDSFTALAEDAGGGLRLIGGRAAIARATGPVPALGAIEA